MRRPQDRPLERRGIGAYKIKMHTREVGLPHVHICYQGKDVVVNLLTLEAYGEKHFRIPRSVAAYLDREQENLLTLWEEHHG